MLECVNLFYLKLHSDELVPCGVPQGIQDTLYILYFSISVFITVRVKQRIVKLKVKTQSSLNMDDATEAILQQVK